MARIDLNRFRKIYPQMKRSPVYFNQTNEIQTFSLAFNSSTSETIQIGAFTSPVVVIAGEDNVNLWITSISQTNNVWSVTINASAAYTGDVHIHVHEATS